MNRIFYFLLCYFFCLQLCAQDKLEIDGYSDVRAFVFSEELPFWVYTNTNGFLNRETNFGVSAFAKANYAITPSHKVSFGIGAFARDGVKKNIQRNDLFVKYENTWFGIVLGAESPEIARQDLSTINDNILLTGNSRALPGILLGLSKPISLGKLSIDAEIAHYELNDQREVTGAQVHYKFLELAWEFSEDTRFSAGLRHYVQWGGITEDGILLPNSFSDYIDVFTGNNATGIDNPNETINALGNHLGSYEITYSFKKESQSINLYHQSLFEDRSGRELNNFPDGVWGIYIETNSQKWLKGILYEYVQTISQSGRPQSTDTEFGQQSGGDNYFSNSIYRSGWTYEGVIIGLPFIIPSRTSPNPNNRIIAHHLGFTTVLGKMNIRSKFTYLQNLGTYKVPFPIREKKLLSFIEINRPTENFGVFNISIGADISNINANTLGIGFGYTYNLH